MGITAYAAEALGDVVYVQVPEAGATVAAGDAVGEVESTKSVSDIFAPVGGEIVEVNQAVVDDPSLVNSDSYGEGWLFRVRIEGDRRRPAVRRGVHRAHLGRVLKFPILRRVTRTDACA